MPKNVTRNVSPSAPSARPESSPSFSDISSSELREDDVKSGKKLWMVPMKLGCKYYMNMSSHLKSGSDCDTETRLKSGVCLIHHSIALMLMCVCV